MAEWSTISDDPNDPAVLRARQAEIDAARHPQIPDRVPFILDRVRGKRVLDIGCVQHTVEAEEADNWLHRHVVNAATSCVGVDIHSDGVLALQAKGYDVVDHDLLSGPGPLAERGPFDVIVCGELIEHLPDPQALLSVTSQLLAPGGEIILTTPNPYAPRRTAAGARLHMWENADHATYLFPSGIAHMASRAGLKLSVTTTLTPPAFFGQLLTSLRVAGPLGRLASLLGPLGRGPARRLTALSRRSPIPIGVLLSLRSVWSTGMVGETAVYVLEHDPAAPSAAMNQVQQEREPAPTA